MKKLGTLAVAVVALMVLTACGERDVAYRATVNADSTLTGAVILTANSATVDYQEELTPIDTPITVTNLTYTYDAASCTWTDVTAVLASAISGTTTLETSVVLTGIDFTGLPPQEWNLGISARTWAGTSINLGTFNGSELGSGCTDPGTYVASSGKFARTVQSDKFGLTRWSEAKRGMAVANIAPAERGYLWALNQVVGPFLNKNVPGELETLVDSIFRGSNFSSYATAPQANGKFRTDLNKVPGVKAYRDEDGGYVVELAFTKATEAEVAGVKWDDQTKIFPTVSTNADVGTLRLDFQYGYFLTSAETPTGTALQTLQNAAENASEIRHSFKVKGLVLFSDGVYTKSTARQDWSLRGWGADAVSSGTEGQLVVFPGDNYKFAKKSSVLSSAVKKAINKRIALYRAASEVRIGYLLDETLSADAVKYAAHKALILKRYNAVRNYLVSSGVKKSKIVKLELLRSTDNPAATKSSLNKVAIQVVD